MNDDTQLATQDKPKTIKGMLNSDDCKKAIADALPKHLTPDRFTRVAITALTKTPKLKICSQESFFDCILTLSQLGLEPDGRNAHLIPYDRYNKKREYTHTECQLIIDYKGLVDLAMRSGQISNLHADVIYEGDIFDYSMGEVKSHVNWFLRTDSEKPESKGNVIGAYAFAKMKDGSIKAEVMSVDELNGIRKRSKASSSGPWVTDTNEMYKKTVFRRMSKWLPLSPEHRELAEKDFDRFEPINVTPKRKTSMTIEEPEDVEQPEELEASEETE